MIKVKNLLESYYHLRREHMSNEERDAVHVADQLRKSNAKDENKLVGHEGWGKTERLTCL